MANTRSAEKNIRKTRSRTLRNRATKSRIRTLAQIDAENTALIETKLVPALRTRDAATYAAVGAKLHAAGDRYNAIARTLGATVCAENPTPSGSSSKAAA